MSQLRLEPEALVGKERAIEALPTLLPPRHPPPLPPTKIREKKSNGEKKFLKKIKKKEEEKKEKKKKTDTGSPYHSRSISFTNVSRISTPSDSGKRSQRAEVW